MKQFLRVLTLICLISVPSLVRATVGFQTIPPTSGCSSVSPFFHDTTNPQCPGAIITWHYFNTSTGQYYTGGPGMASGSLPNPTFTVPGSYNITEIVNCGGVIDSFTK